MSDNVALGKECTLSSYFYYTHQTGDSDNDDFTTTHHENNTCHDVINDNTSTSYGKGNCVFTHWKDFTPRWTVNLGQNYVISTITIYARELDESNRGRNRLSLMRGVKVSIDNTTVHTFGDDVNNIEPKTDILLTLPRSGQEVEVTRQKPADESRDYLTFCEIQVWACDDSHYGSNCDQSCGQCSSGTSCNKTNGECQRGCQSGWQAPMCTQKCSPRTYGDCSQQCSKGCVGLCDTSTGTCTCKAGWGTNNKCDDCDNQHYDRNDDCQDECGHCKNGPACDKNTGHCPSGCQPGWKQPMCQDQCDAGYYDDCSKQCGAGCDGHCTRSANCHTCDVATGHCSCRPRWGPDTTCTDCANGHYNRSSDCSGQCGHCDGGNPCNKDTGYCRRCEPGWKPLLCQEECSDGLYGQDCGSQCGHCSEGQPCNKVIGTCTSCQPGFEIPLCQLPCRSGHYGVNCNKTCGQCANNDACNKTTGHCPGSCLGAFKPPLCDSLCEDGFYGTDCGTCGQCGGDEVCDKDTGHCTACQSGWSPPLCQQECESGRHGADCNATCGHCRQNCRPDTGVCDDGCHDGFDGDMCDRCLTSLWGAECTLPCGHCAGDGSCDKTTGQCLTGHCVPGWNGTRCLQAIPKGSDNTGKDSSNTTLIATIAGVGVILAVAIIILAVVIWLRKSRSARSHRDNSDPKNIHPRFKETSIDEPSPALPPRLSAPMESTHVAEQGTETLSDPYDRLDNYEIREDDIRPYDDLTHPSKDYYNTKPMGTEERKQVTTEYQNTTEGSSYEEITVSKASGIKSQEDIERHRKKKISGKEKHIYTNA